MKILGIDPGKKGAGVWLNEQGEYVGHFLMPLCADEIDYSELALYFLSFKDIHVFIENVPMPFKGSKGSKGTYMVQGKIWGIIRGLLYGMNIKTSVIHPKTWTTKMHKWQPKDLAAKDKSYKVFTEELCLDPQKIFGCKAKAKIGGLIDAYLIALYGVKEGK